MKVHRNRCGLDVHKVTIAASLIRDDASGNSSNLRRQELLPQPGLAGCERHQAHAAGPATSSSAGARVGQGVTSMSASYGTSR